ncbi:MAG TPA: hypothetical protein VLJ21_01555 [Candidatus Binatia bacterium]|nr:hypothetical protein [Candidatus Binatia bacterium]
MTTNSSPPRSNQSSSEDTTSRALSRVDILEKRLEKAFVVLQGRLLGEEPISQREMNLYFRIKDKYYTARKDEGPNRPYGRAA